MDVMKQHFVLVHGAGHGAWCWYKVETLLTAAGHKVTSLDMAASGTDPRQVDDVTSLSDYFEPLTRFMESVSADERVILVGHSFNGFTISLAMEKFPEKIAVAVFATAVMPPTLASLANWLKQIIDEWRKASEGGTRRLGDDSEKDAELPTSIIFEPEYMATTMYQNSPPEDVTLAVKSVRPFPMFSMKSMLEVLQLSKARYGSVRRAFVKTGQDKMHLMWRQEMMISMFPPDMVKTIDEADHMVMVSTPHELYESLVDIAQSLA